MPSRTSLSFANEGASTSRRRFRHSTELYVPDGEGGSEDRAISITTAQINENKDFIHNLQVWAIARKANSITITGKGIARLVEKIAKDGRVSEEDEDLILETIATQRGWWATLVVMDTLIIALATAQLCFEELADNGHWSKEAGERILFAYHTCLAILLYFTICHLAMVLFVAGLSAYIFEVKGILTFFVQCHTLLVHLNFSGLLFLVPGCWVVPVLAQTYSFGLEHALPSLILCCFAVLAIIILYGKVVKPLFLGLYNEEYDIGSYEEDTEKEV